MKQNFKIYVLLKDGHLINRKKKSFDFILKLYLPNYLTGIVV